MKSIWDFIVSNWLSIVSIVFGLYFGLRSISAGNKKKLPVMYYKTVPIIKNAEKIKDLSVLYKNEKINNLFLSVIVFFNQGQLAIKKEDIDPNKPVEIIFPRNCNILHVQDVFKNPTTSSIFSHHIAEQNKIKIEFPFLNQNSGIVTYVYHKAYSDNISISVSASIADSKKIVIKKDAKSFDSLEQNSFRAYILTTLPSMYLTVGFTNLIWSIATNNLPYLYSAVIMIVLGVLLTILKYIKSVPKEFQRYINI